MALTVSAHIANSQISDIVQFIVTNYNLARQQHENTIVKAKTLAPTIINTVIPAHRNEVFHAFSRENIHAESQEEIKYFTSFLLYLKRFVEEPELIDAEVEYDGLNRMPNPPKEAYWYTGNNKMDVKETAQGYALLLG